MTARKTDNLTLWILTGLCLLPFLWLQARLSMSADVAWLTGAAGHILSGDKMAETFFDNNPPLCYLVYIPAALLVKAGVPVWVAVLVYTEALAGLSVALTALLLRGWPDLARVRFFGLIAVWCVASLFPARFEWGQKDHLIALTLLPFLLAQYALTNRHNVPGWVIKAALILGTPFILMKPHYGLLPVLMLLHRALKQKRLSLVSDFDFLALAIGVVLYALVIALRFPDYVTEVLGPGVSLYAALASTKIFKAVVGLALLSVSLLGLTASLPRTTPLRSQAVCLCALALAALIPLAAQMKGFSSHMLPAFGLTAIAAFLSLSLLFRLFDGASRSRAALVILAVFALGYAAFPPNLSYPSATDYKQTTLAKLVVEKAQGASFLMQSESTNVVIPVSVYTGIPFASRFSSLWFMGGMTDNLRPVFGNDVAEDLARHKPSLVLLYAAPRSPAFDLVKIFGGIPAFDREWAHYRRQGQFTLNSREYFGGTSYENNPPVVYDIFVRDPSQ